MVERVLINSSQIILKDATSAETFNTANLYLKTDPSGQLKAGGYAECPSVWGTGSGISNKPTGWYPAQVVEGTYTKGQNLVIAVPKSTSSKLVTTANVPLEPASLNFFSQPQIAYFNGANSGRTFRWVGNRSVTGGDEYSGVSIVYYAWIEFDFSISSAVSGTWTFFGVPLNLWTRTVSDNEGGSYTQNYQSLTSYGEYSEYNYPIYWLNFCVMTLSSPTTLSVATTL